MLAPTSQDQRVAIVERFFRGTGSSYDTMVNVATLGIDRRWKRRLVSKMPADATRVLDLACGTGISTQAILHRFPDCEVVGVELREEYLRLARERFRGTPRVELVLTRAEDYYSSEPFDCISSSYLAKYADLPVLCRNVFSMLRSDGTFLAHDFTYPPKRHLVWLFNAYFFVMQRIGARVIPSWREIFYGLPELIARSRWVDVLETSLLRTGFVDVRCEHLTLHGAAIVSARKP
jgi:demethylmenaquinone methyltransferase / 2-methoxy-6-polyprenyl-1,4-benzoquinol methylase